MSLFRRNTCNRGSPLLRRLTRLSVFLSAFSLAATAHATDYYVATNGSDSNAGSQAAPWRSVKHAVDTMVAGDTTYVKGGVYNDRNIWFTRSGTQSAPIRLLNAPGEFPIIDGGNGGSGSGITIINGSGANHALGWITIEGFEIRHFTNGIVMRSAHDMVIRRNYVHDNYSNDHSVGIAGNGLRVLIDRNRIEHNGSFAFCALDSHHCNQDHGIYATGTNWTITNNVIVGNLSQGIQVAGYPWCADGKCYGGGSENKAGPEYGGVTGWLIANNTIAYNYYNGAIVLWQPDTTNTRIINNIFYDNGLKGGGTPNGVEFLHSGGGHIIQNNICYSTTKATVCIGPGAGKYTGSNNVTVNPNFVNPTGGNFQLQPSSPAIDKGLTLSEVTWDYAGGKRPYGAAYDIGAYEFGAPPDSGSPPPNPTGGDFSPGGAGGGPVFYAPDGSVCPSGYSSR